MKAEPRALRSCRIGAGASPRPSGAPSSWPSISPGRAPCQELAVSMSPRTSGDPGLLRGGQHAAPGNPGVEVTAAVEHARADLDVSRPAALAAPAGQGLLGAAQVDGALVG